VLITAFFNLRIVQPLSPQPPAWAKVAKGLKIDGLVRIPLSKRKK
jgi:hypothetical protein